VEEKVKTGQKDIVSTILKIVLGLFFIGVWALILFGEGVAPVRFMIPNFCLFIAGSILLVLVVSGWQYLHINKLKIFLEKREKLCLGVISGILLVVQLFIIYETIFQTAWDVQAVWYGSLWAALGDKQGISDMSEYFSIYPNNLLLVFIFSRVLKLKEVMHIPIENGGMLLAFVQAVIVNITGIIIYRCARYFGSVLTAWGVYIGYILLIGVSGWIVIPYSDGMGILFPVLMLYLYLKLKDTDTIWKKDILVFLLFGTGMIAYHIKPYTVIVLIAIVILEVWKSFSCIGKGEEAAKRWKRGAVYVLCAISACCISMAGIQTASNSMGFDIDHERALEVSHHLLIGINKETWGGFNENVLAFSQGIPDKNERTRAEMNAVYDRLKEMNATEYLNFTWQKAAKNYLNGTFGWGMDEGFYTEIYPSRGKICDVLRTWYYGYEEAAQYHMLILQFVWIITLILVPFSVFVRRKLSDQEQVTILSVIGLMLYLQIFEAHARYIFVFVPFFLILAACGAANIRGFMGRKKEKNE
jgi:hypothetical protein